MARAVIYSAAVLACAASFQVEQAAAIAGAHANVCVAIVGQSGTAPRKSHVIKNICDRDIGVLYCHTATGGPGTGDSVCGNRGQYYQQRISLRPGQTHANYYSQPADSRVHWAACFDNQFFIKQNDRSGSGFFCDYPQKR